MRLKKWISIFFFGLGCMVVFIGLAATILPMIQNDQLRLVLSSFEEPSRNPIVSAINALMGYALRNCYLVMLVGASLALLGALVMLTVHPRQEPVSAAEGSTLTEWPPPIPPKKAASAANQPNPFADTSLAEMLTPKAALPRNDAQPNPFAAFAPKREGGNASAKRMSSGDAPAARNAEGSPYARPASAAPPATAAPAAIAPPAATTPAATTPAAIAAPTPAAFQPATSPSPASAAAPHACEPSTLLKPHKLSGTLVTKPKQREPLAPLPTCAAREPLAFSLPTAERLFTTLPCEPAKDAPVPAAPVPAAPAPKRTRSAPVASAPRTQSRIKSTMGKQH
ncbi:MAG: hypothetical protein RSB91_06170 [Clostridia bacterium]